MISAISKYLKSWPNDFNQWREEWIKVHRKVQLKLDIIVAKLGLQFLKVLVQRTEERKEIRCIVLLKYFMLSVFCADIKPVVLKVGIATLLRVANFQKRTAKF
jgi:hypothetical protein